MYSPALDQAILIKKLIKKYLPQYDIESRGKINDEINKFSEYIHIPTGAASTEILLKRGDVRLGEIVLTRSALQVFDKSWLLEQCSEIGVLTPITWERIQDITSYPIFYKQCYEKGGGERGVAYSENEIPKNKIEALIFQELIVSKGTYGVSFLADKGCLLVAHSHFESESLPIDGGSAVIIECFNDKRLLNYTKKLIEGIQYSGWGLAEYKYCPKRKDYVLMEINAKFWTSCELAFVNEPKFVKLLFNINLDEKPINRLLFVDRAMQRGVFFFIKEVILSSRKTTLRLYSGWGLRLMISVMPSWLYSKIKLLINRHK